MTAEIGMLNKYGVALAADSAVTIGGGKGYYNTANKLFALSKYEPVAIMIYSNAEFMGYPVEIIIKEYRKKLGNASFEKLQDYWNDFLAYLKEFFKKNSTNKECMNYYLSEANSLLRSIDLQIREDIDELAKEEIETVSIQDKVIELIEKHIDNMYQTFLSFDDDKLYISRKSDIITEYSSEIENMVCGIFGIVPKGELIEKIKELCVMILTKQHNMGSRTGIVITGYGTDEMYPSIISGEFMGCFYENLKYTDKENNKITNENTAIVVPFAQSDVVSTFINGYDAKLIEKLIETIDSSLADGNCNDSECRNNLIKDIIKNVQEYSQNNHWGPILDTVEVAPKEELAQMAETLVNLTSFRRKLTLDDYSQTVGGPIDVALITKGDGLVWIKRKFYFDDKLNYNFYNNYYKENGRNERELTYSQTN